VECFSPSCHLYQSTAEFLFVFFCFPQHDSKDNGSIINCEAAQGKYRNRIGALLLCLSYYIKLCMLLSKPYS